MNVFLKVNLPSTLEQILEATDYSGAEMLQLIQQGLSQLDPRIELAGKTVLVCEGVRFNPYKPEIAKSLACMTFTDHEICAYGEKRKDASYDIRDEFARLTFAKFADPQLVAMIIHTFRQADEDSKRGSEPSRDITTRVYSSLFEMVFERSSHCVLFDDNKKPNHVKVYDHPYLYLGGRESAELLNKKVGTSFREMMERR